MAKRGRPQKPTARNVKGRKASKVDLENLKKAWGKATGPKTSDGKAKSSMNALKTGEHMRMFFRISHQAGELKICEGCGEEQQNACRSAQTCLLQDSMIASYMKAQAEKNPDHIEEFTIVQVATMDMVFSVRLKYALDHINDTWTDPETGKTQFVINSDYMYMLMNLFDRLNKRLEDMQLTRKTIDDSDLGWNRLVDEKIDREEAKAYLEKLQRQLTQIRNDVQAAAENRSQDKDIQEYQKQTGNDEDDTPINLDNVGDNVFGSKD